MGIKTYDLNNIFRDKIHGPRDKSSGKVYYLPKMSSKEMSDADKELAKMQDMYKAKTEYLNSPTNVRRVWISATTVVVEYYAAPRNKDKPNKLTVKRKFKTSLKDIAKDYIRYNSLNTAQKAMEKTKKDPIEEVRVKGRGIQAIQSPWTCNNIEEIYFDWTVFTSIEAYNIFVSFLNNGINLTDNIKEQIKLLKKYYNREEKFALHNSEMPKKLFVGAEKDNIRSTLKRLRVIAMVSKLDDLISNDSFEKHLTKFDIQKNNLEVVTSVWLNKPEVSEWAKNNNCEIWRYDIKLDKNKVNNKTLDSFTIKTANYIFDDEVLDAKIKSYISCVKDKIIDDKAEAKAKEEEENRAEAGTAEELLEELKNKYGEGYVTCVVRAAYSEMKRREPELVKYVLPSMPPKLKDYYTRLITGNKK